MRFSSLTVIALLSSDASAFTIPGLKHNTFNRNQRQSQHQHLQQVKQHAGILGGRRNNVILNMAGESKEEKLQSIQDSIDAAKARRLALEAELAAADEAALQLQLEAEKAAAAPEPVDLSGLAEGPLPLVGGAVVAAAGARSALENRGEVQKEKERQEEIKRAAEEQDARNRAAAAAKGAGGSNVSSYFLLFLVDFYC
jgi:hypothetical protein